MTLNRSAMKGFGTVLLLIAVSAATYLAHYLIFRDAKHIFIYLLGDIAFLPFEVLIVSLVIHRLLDRNEKKKRLEKLNILIGVFFSEVGDGLIRILLSADQSYSSLSDALAVRSDWADTDWDEAMNACNGFASSKELRPDALREIKEFLSGKRGFLMTLLQSPSLYEHERFTELLRAIFHLAEELDARPGIQDLPAEDIKHLSGDVNRISSALVARWLDHMKYLKTGYPYLFSLAARMNPYISKRSAVIRKSS